MRPVHSMEASMRSSEIISIFSIKLDISSRPLTHVMGRKSEGFSMLHVSFPEEFITSV